jgi:hypothetical protein
MHPRSLTRSVACLAFACLLAACGPQSSDPTGTGGQSGLGGNVGNVGSTGGTGGGTSSTGGASASGGAPGTGGVIATGGVAGSASGTGGAAGGRGGKGGGAGAAGGRGGKGGDASGGAAGGAIGTGGIAGSGGGTGAVGPCDIFQSASTPCVAAHSTVRALYGAYSGNLYQVRRASDKTTKDVPVASPGGYADASVQDEFCSGTTCTISIIYDQSPSHNDVTKAPAGGFLHNGGLEADATAAKITANGHTVYGVYTTSNSDNDVGAVGYRNNKTKGIATGDNPETIYAVLSGKRYNQYCCFDYGNAETDNKDDGNATMEALYYGTSTQWGKGSGAGPWVMADMENGLFAGGSTAAQSTNTPLTGDYVTGYLKGPSGNRFVLKGGDAQSGTLSTKYDGARPTGYSPMKKQGAIVLGLGGDNSHTGQGTFFEGCMTAGVPSDATDDAVQANIVAAGYGH